MQIATIDYQAPHAAQLFTQSLRQTGFAVIVHHPLDWDLIQSIYVEWLNFFQSEGKHQYRVRPDMKGGFFPADLSETAKGQTVKDLKEFFHIFPSGVFPEHLSNQTHQYYQQALLLAKQLLQWIQDFSPADVQKNYSEPLPQMIEGSESLLRILRYTPIDTQDDYVRAAAHEDINLITILPAATAPGLQVKDISGQWYDVPVEPNSIIINIGDMLQEASQFYYPSTTHRVVKYKNQDLEQERIAMPFFLQPRKDVVLSERYTAGAYHTQRMQELKVIQDGKILL
ncbi:2OG-Fe(II) oxygenase family protein [Acinetobacter ihumii]|uniref:2OG-Fe(II) oxygenase family protein n=1 Tax=Acinetobacter ihumii TaxID=2483802 RepID=UPI00103025E4|nr:2OG-Fe(II) oxygenase family protein [Acinetobacter ihumii]